MKYRLSVFFLIFSTIVYAQPYKDSTAIARLIIDDYTTLQNWDIQKHKQNCTADYTLIENGEIQSFADESEYFRKNAHRKIVRTDSFQYKHIRVAKTFGYAVYTLQSKIIEQGNVKVFNWSESVICRKVKGEWKIALLHSTLVKSQ